MKTLTTEEMCAVNGGDLFDDAFALAEQGLQKVIDGLGMGMNGPSLGTVGFAGIGEIILGEIIMAYDLVFSGPYTPPDEYMIPPGF